MSKATKVLQLGPVDYSAVCPLYPGLEWYYEINLSETTEKWFDVVILDRNITPSEKKRLFRLAKAYCLFILEDIVPNGDTAWLLASKKGQTIKKQELSGFLAEEIRDYFPSPYGEKFVPSNLAVGESFQGSVKWNGYTGVTLKGDFGTEFMQIAYWRNNIPVFCGQSIDFWLEYTHSEAVEVKLCITQFVPGSVGDVQNYWEFDEEAMKDIVYITNEKQDAPIFVSLQARGQGELTIIGLHDRYSRRGKGNFLPGGERVVTSKREEIFFYFDPGDLKPPLNVYFSGYKTQEGFEGYNMLRKMGAPFLLVSESRLEGGGFYLGDEEFEDLLRTGISHYLEELGFSSDQLIFSGLSMGTFGALYYGCDFRPLAILAGKPLASIGNVAANERIYRAGGFPTSLDVLWKQYQSLGQEAIDRLNERFWSKFDAVEWENTKFIISYMIEDDYDDSAYPSLLSHIRDDCIEIYGKGLHGRHNDNTSGIVGWFISRFNNILKEHFEREF